LIFLEREEGRKGICSTAYTKQVLDTVIGLYYDLLSPDQKEKFYGGRSEGS